jgi:hypothetical protein
MNALLDAIESAMRRSQRRRAALATAAVVALAVTGTRVDRGAAPAEVPSCDLLAREFGRVWNEPRRAELARRHAASPIPGAAARWREAEQLLQYHASALADAHARLCAPVRGRAPADPAHLQRLETCVRRSLAETDGLLGGVDPLDPVVLRSLPAAVDALWSPSWCGDPGSLLLSSGGATSPGLVVARAHSELMLGRSGAAQELLARVTPRPGDGSELLLRAQIQYVQGRIDLLRNNRPAAEHNLRQAFFGAQAHGAAVLGARAALALAALVALDLQRPQEGLEWARHAEALIARLPATGPLETTLAEIRARIHTAAGSYGAAAEALQQLAVLAAARPGPVGQAAPRQVLVTMAGLLADMGTHERALGHARRALALFAEARVEDHPDHIEAALVAARVASLRGDAAAARSYGTSALRQAQAFFGKAHPEVAGHHATLASILRTIGDPRAAETHLRSALDIWRRGRVTPGPAQAAVLVELASIEREAHRLGWAVAHLEEALRIREAMARPDDLELAALLHTLGSARVEAGAAQAAVESLERAARIRQAHLAADDQRTQASLRALAAAHQRLGNRDRARELLYKLRALDKQEGGAADPAVVAVVLEEAEAELQNGQHSRARSLLTRAARLAERTTVDHLTRGRIELGLMQVLRTSAPDRAMLHARRASSAYRRAGIDDREISRMIREGTSR